MPEPAFLLLLSRPIISVWVPTTRWNTYKLLLILLFSQSAGSAPPLPRKRAAYTPQHPCGVAGGEGFDPSQVLLSYQNLYVSASAQYPAQYPHALTLSLNHQHQKGQLSFSFGPLSLNVLVCWFIVFSTILPRGLHITCRLSSVTAAPFTT